MAAKYTSDELDDMVAKGHAMKNANGDPSYPVKDEDDLDKAIHAVGRGGADHDAIRQHIIKRAKALGLSSKIPDNWGADGSLKGSSSAPRLLDPAFALRRRRRGSMVRRPERRSMPMEMRARPDGTGGTTFEFEGYGSVFNEPFPMWDQWGEEYREVVMPGAFKRSLATPGLYVPFLIGHDDRGLPLAQTCNGTMQLSEDSHGLHVLAQMDGRRTDVQNLAYAVERGDMTQMSIGFMTMGQEWSPDFEQRAMLDLELDGGDVSSVAIAASRATAGSTMTALPTEALRQDRPAERRAADEIVDMSGAPDYNPVPHAFDPGAIPCTATASCTDQGVKNSPDAKFCDQCGSPVPAESYSGNGTEVVDDSGVVEDIEGAAMSDAELLGLQRLRLELLSLTK